MNSYEKIMTVVVVTVISSLLNMNMAQAQADKEIVLGQSASFTGSFSAQATSYRDGALLYFDYINSHGGVNGRKIKLLSLDDGYKVDQAVANTKKFLETEKVFALFNYTWTNTVKATIPLAEAAKVPMIAPYTGFQELYGTHYPYVFTTRASFLDELNQIIQHLTVIGIERISLLHNDSASGKDLLQDTTQILAKHNRKIQAVGVMKINSKDAGTAIKALNVPNNQVIILGASGSDAISFIRDFEKIATEKPQYYARSLINANQLVKELGPQSEGIAVTQTAPNPFKADRLVAAEYRKILAQKDPNARPDYIALEGFISAKVFVEALRRSGNQPTREKLVQALESLKKFDVGGYTIDFDKNNHHGSHYVDITLIGRKGRIFD